MRGYYGIGVENISKAMNLGNLFRSAHAFGASFIFTVAANYERKHGLKSDTSDSIEHLPFYSFPDPSALILPTECKMIGIELWDSAIDLPSFRHPQQAAYILGPERGELSPETHARCDWVVKIPSKFCVNVGIAGALGMYDRIISLGRFPRRADKPGPPTEEFKAHQHGGRFSRLAGELDVYLDRPPEGYND